MSMTTFWKKEILFEEGDVGNYFFFILSGSVVIRKRHGSTSTCAFSVLAIVLASWH